MLHMLGLVGRGLARYRTAAGVQDSFVQTAVAAVSVVGLLAAVVGLDDEGIGPVGDITGGGEFTMQGCGHVPQQGMERDLEGSF